MFNFFQESLDFNYFIFMFYKLVIICQIMWFDFGFGCIYGWSDGIVWGLVLVRGRLGVWLQEK